MAGEPEADLVAMLRWLANREPIGCLITLVILGLAGCTALGLIVWAICFTVLKLHGVSW